VRQLWACCRTLANAGAIVAVPIAGPCQVSAFEGKPQENSLGAAEAERAEAESYPELRKGVAILVRAGWSTADIVHAICLAQLSEDEFDETGIA